MKTGQAQTPTVHGSTPTQFFENQRYLSVKELAKVLGVSNKTIYGWVYRGILQPKRVGPHLIRFDSREIEEWVSSHKGDPNGS